MSKSKSSESESYIVIETKKNIYQRLIEVQKKVTTIQKNETVKMSETDKGYKAVTHDDVAAALHIPLAECGVFMLPDILEYSNSSFDKMNKYNYLQTWYRTDLKIKVKWINVDDPTDFIESTGASFALDTSDKSFAKAYSLALKIVLLKVHLLESRDGEEQRPFDDANNSNEGNENKGKKQNNRSAGKETGPIPNGPTPNDLPKPKSPLDYVMPIGGKGITGKRLGELSSNQLEKIIVWANDEMKKKPAPARMQGLIDINTNVKAALKAVPKPSLPTPNPDPENNFPADMPDSVPTPEHEPQTPQNDLWDYIIPIPVQVEGVNGVPLAMIPEADLKASIDDISKQMQATNPRPTNVGNMLEVITIIKKFLASTSK